MGKLLDEDTVIKVLEHWKEAFKENSHHVSASDLSLVIKDVRELPTIQPEKAQLSKEGTTSDLIDRRAALDIFDDYNVSVEYGELEAYSRDRKRMCELPPAQPEPHDLVSRQAAIDALDVLCQEHRYRIPGKRETYSEYNEAWQDALDRAEGLIFNLPTVQPEPQWIPISDRLPEDGTWNIFTDGKNISVERYKEDAIDHFFPAGRWFQLEDVIAWMPLPEAYKPNK